MSFRRALKSQGYKEIPPEISIRIIYDRFYQNVSVDDLPQSKKFQESQRTRVDAILAEIKANEISAKVQMSNTNIFNLMHWDLNSKSYKIQIYRWLFEEDYDRR